jgi:hypothetical protein
VDEIGWAFLGLAQPDQEFLLAYYLADKDQLLSHLKDRRFDAQLKLAFRNLEQAAIKRGIE